jgi:hypothetical protein
MQFGIHFKQGSCSLVRSIKILAGLVAFAAISAPLLQAETALQAGEELTYSVRWAVLPSAGQIQISASRTDVEGSPRLSITTSTETRGLAKSLLTFQARSESIFDLRSGRIVALRESSVARAKRVEYAVAFDHKNHQALFTPKDADVTRALELPEGDPADLITTLMKTRLWDLDVGQSRDALVSYRDDFYDLTIYATKTEQVKTPLGKFDSVVLEPRMEKTPPKGMFKRGANVRVWVSRDEARLPVRFQVEFKVGTGVATLVKYRPPAAVSDGPVAADE